jgi:hypothetical protein
MSSTPISASRTYVKTPSTRIAGSTAAANGENASSN